jgi:hypothetical protein
VRKGLAILGVAIALVGIGVMIAAFSITPVPTGSFVQQVGVPKIAAHANLTRVVSSRTEGSARVVFSWGSSESLEVGIYVAGPCTGNSSTCPVGPPLKMWYTNSGAWLYTGSVSTAWFLSIVNPNATVASFNSTLVETYPAVTQFPLSEWSVLLLIIGALVLIAIGGLAVFLGSFLRSGVYGPAPGLTAPPDSAILGPPDDDDLEDFDDGTEPPGGDEPEP